MSKIYVEKENDIGCSILIWIAIIFAVITILIANAGGGDLEDAAGTAFCIILVVIILLIVFFATKSKRVLKRYKNNNPNLAQNIDKNTYKNRVLLDEENKIMYLFANDWNGTIIALPFNEFISFELYAENETSETNDNWILKIKTSANDINLSVIEITCKKKYVPNIEKILNYFITQLEKGAYNN